MPRVSRPVRIAGPAALAYAAAGAVALSLSEPAKGWAVLVTSFGGCAALLLVARLVGIAAWRRAAAIAVAVSVFQIFPDWFLADALGTLRFPDTGGIRVGHAIPLAMCGMWALPLFVVVLAARGSAVRGALVAFAVFLATELAAPSLGLWEPAGPLTKVAGVALYVLPAEAALGAATVLAVRATERRSAGERVAAVVAVSTLYTGALALAWFLINRAGWSLSA